MDEYFISSADFHVLHRLEGEKMGREKTQCWLRIIFPPHRFWWHLVIFLPHRHCFLTFRFWLGHTAGFFSLYSTSYFYSLFDYIYFIIQQAWISFNSCYFLIFPADTLSVGIIFWMKGLQRKLNWTSLVSNSHKSPCIKASISMFYISIYLWNCTFFWNVPGSLFSCEMLLLEISLRSPANSHRGSGGRATWKMKKFSFENHQAVAQQIIEC